MSDATTIFGALTLATVATAVATPAMIRIARRTNFYDHPTGYKKHSASTPYLGGIAIVAGTLVAAAVFSSAFEHFVPLLACAVGLLVVGTIDDRLRLGIGIRLLAQVLAALLVWEAGLGWHVLGTEAADFALTIIWVVGLTNAFNLFDNSDGAAATVGAAGSAGAAVLALAYGDLALAAIAIAVAGACIGFLPYNLAHPCRIFMGDGGSMPLGLLVAGMIMAEPTGDLGWAALPAYALLVALPILDTTLVVFSRWRRRAAILSGGRDHITHRLLLRLGSVQRVALALGIAQLGLCAVAIILAETNRTTVVIATFVYLAAAAVALARFEGPDWRSRSPEQHRSRREQLLLGEKGPA